MSKALRFGALVRVSTEQQEKTGESLRTQKTDNIQSVKQLGGTIVEWYGGQEHATPGFEKKEIDRLIKDAQENRFDAVIVCHADRWSRDNSKSQEGLDILRRHRVDFYIGTTRYDLFNPEHCLFLGISAEMGRFYARNQNRKSIQNRINRAMRGIPTAGKSPFGRRFNRQKNVWEVDGDKKAMVEDIAKRYLAGEPMPALARQYGVNHANLHKTLMQRCGSTWLIAFRSDDLNIHETVEIAVPPLLDAKTIKALQQQAEANKTYRHGRAKHPYLFAGMVFCDHCGYAMFGQTNHRGIHYYRHAHKERARECLCRPRPWVRCDVLDDAVVRHLFECFGNPEAVQRAIEKATPNLEQLKEQEQRIVGLQSDLARVNIARDRIIRFVSRGAITDDQAEPELFELKDREKQLKVALEELEQRMRHHPNKETIRNAAHEAADAFQRRFRLPILTRRAVEIRSANHDFEGMSFEDKLVLARAVFSGYTADGKPMGIYVRMIDGQTHYRHKRWRFVLHGKAINASENYGVDGWQIVTPYALHSPGIAPRAPGCCGRWPSPAA